MLWLNHSILLFNAKSFTYPFLFINPKLPMCKEITQSEHRKGEVCQCTEIRIYLVLVWFLVNLCIPENNVKLKKKHFERKTHHPVCKHSLLTHSLNFTQTMITRSIKMTLLLPIFKP